jgi:hypothetical protein
MKSPLALWLASGPNKPLKTPPKRGPNIIKPQAQPGAGAIRTTMR